MIQYVPQLFTSPSSAWSAIREEADHQPWGFLPVLLLGALIPAICTYIGAAHVGWQLFGSDQTQYLSPTSAALMALMGYLAFITGVIMMGLVTRWVLFRTPQRPPVLTGVTFATFMGTPLMLGGLVALYPYAPLVLAVAALTSGGAAILLFIGLPAFMHLARNDQTRFRGACILGVGFLVLLTTGFTFMELWWDPLSGGEYMGPED